MKTQRSGRSLLLSALLVSGLLSVLLWPTAGAQQAQTAQTQIAQTQTAPPAAPVPPAQVSTSPTQGPIPAATASPLVPVDYRQAASWLCRPDLAQDACTTDLSATVIRPDGRTAVQRFHRSANAPIDCFYVYPTISLDRTPNSDLKPGSAEEVFVTQQQFARFGGVCRLFAPVYRQVTLASLTGVVPPGDRALAYADVLNAWTTYMRDFNQGRGVVLIGHSQGSSLLKVLIQQQIDGKPAQRQLISAIIPGTSVAVPPGQDVGGDFRAVPLCRQVHQLGCVVSYASFRASSPPPANSLFGRAASGMVAACVNPAALGGGLGLLEPYFTSQRRLIALGSGAPEPGPWLRSGAAVTTPAVTLPRYLAAQCVQDARGSYLSVTVNDDPAGPRTGELVGDVYVNGQLQPQWGLHVIDINEALGTLVRLVREQSAAYLRK